METCLNYTHTLTEHIRVGLCEAEALCSSCGRLLFGPQLCAAAGMRGVVYLDIGADTSLVVDDQMIAYGRNPGPQTLNHRQELADGAARGLLCRACGQRGPLSVLRSALLVTSWPLIVPHVEGLL